MVPEELIPAPNEVPSCGLVIPQAGKVPLGAAVGKEVEETKELLMNPARGRQGGHHRAPKRAGATARATASISRFVWWQAHDGGARFPQPLRLGSILRQAPGSSWYAVVEVKTCARETVSATVASVGGLECGGC